MILPVVRPSFYVCEGCSQWDDINGCWADCQEFGESDYCTESYHHPYHDEEEAGR